MVNPFICQLREFDLAIQAPMLHLLDRAAGKDLAQRAQSLHLEKFMVGKGFE